FFFQAEDGIRDFHVTGVQTCALPISNAEATRYPFEVTIEDEPLSLEEIEKHLAEAKRAEARCEVLIKSIRVAGAGFWAAAIGARSEERRVGKERIWKRPPQEYKERTA